MLRVEHEVTINRPPSEVFAYLADLEKIPEWQATAISARLESERLEKGARAVEVRRFLGREMESTIHVTDLEPQRRLAADVVAGPLEYRFSHELEPEDGGTKILFTIEGDPGRYFSFAEPVVERQVRKQVADDFRTLKLLLETEAG